MNESQARKLCEKIMAVVWDCEHAHPKHRKCEHTYPHITEALLQVDREAREKSEKMVSAYRQIAIYEASNGDRSTGWDVDLEAKRLMGETK